MWECHDNYWVDSDKLQLSDRDLGSAASDVASCQGHCVASDGCVAIRWHKTDSHCHLLSGTTPSKDKFMAALVKDDHDTACVLSTALVNESDEHAAFAFKTH